MKIMILTDAAPPQTNGVVTTLQHTIEHLKKKDYEVWSITPRHFRTVACPTYPEIRLSFARRKHIEKMVKDGQPDYIHIATEGPIGLAGARACQKNGWKYTTSYHTRYPEYIKMRFPYMPMWIVEKYLRKIHRRAVGTLTTTPAMSRDLHDRRISYINCVWGRGIDLETFSPASNNSGNLDSFMENDDVETLPIVLLYVGRISMEKNIEAFLDIDESRFNTRVEKRVVGNGPQLESLKKRYKDKPNIIFTGKKTGKDLAEEYRNADVMVFPSKTDTFGIVMLESMACGTPVAGFPVTGPKDVILSGINGSMDEDLVTAIHSCLKINRGSCYNSVKLLSWDTITNNFINGLEACHNYE